ncbi:FAD-binding monooxygenase [Variovorax sp. WS11]|uniref:bifunctional 3-(3-hydroxy-phenyl)propionate/3-hydroxycinnamic acid hydroxylase n=1 Tax=Variovorax sp. WS11 TaxID=1105204 RepID=UPI000D0D6F42|nr:bifunctional 3-(3-hydroxy-phenyl)propionate/3-hydroxycinnamic acid hydroxylase [Variovorax sp. WS11]NDZ15063.1 bifunctional 3-(3-hydroxy-phenyl)propionate/3-hydroxycinnamic acid hydroxylase [Variovorax sp. WS11]PSL85535.1 FAD-binding monooxygenase [Variovorax sp. WS11]
MNPIPGPPVEVAIVGFGPVGATLAALLGRRGRRVAVFDKSEQIYPLPRAFALDHEAMRTFQEIGIAGALAPHMTPYRPTIYQGADGEPIQHFDMGPSPYPLAWAPSYTFNQPALEASLRRAVGLMPSVSVHLGHEVGFIEDEGEQVRLSVRAPDGSSGEVRARYVIACDGGTSPARKQLGLQLRSLDFDEPWVVIDMHIDEDVLERLPATNIQYCNPARPCTYVVGPGTHRRWEFLLLPHETGQRDMPHEAIWKLLAPWLAPHEARIWRAATYRFHAVVLDPWRRGRVLLAGDAAHQMPPFLAQGMCQGLRDATNLAWKLDWVLRGKAPESLLDSYGTERGPQVEETTRTVKRLGQIICERDPARAAQRDQGLRAQQGGEVRVQLRQSLLPGVRHGLVEPGHDAAGTPFPQAVGRVGAHGAAEMMDDLLPRGFLLFLREAPAPAQLQALQSGLDALDAKAVCLHDANGIEGLLGLAEADGVLARWFEAQGCGAALVRPDHIVYGVAADIGGAAELLEWARQSAGLREPCSLSADAASG